MNLKLLITLKVESRNSIFGSKLWYMKLLRLVFKSSITRYFKDIGSEKTELSIYFFTILRFFKTLKYLEAAVYLFLKLNYK